MDTSNTNSPSRFAFLRLARRPQRTTFTPEEVRQRLRSDDATHPRTRAVHAAAAHTGIWSSLLSDKVAADLGRAGNSLPLVVYWFRQGLSNQEIGQRLSPFGGAWDADRAVGVAATLIAQILNSPGFLNMVA
ncbi:MAG TPA: hypothetical protein VGE94_11110 [Chloroflexota bacterium]|jgi:hypothetical protein